MPLSKTFGVHVPFITLADTYRCGEAWVTQQRFRCFTEAQQYDESVGFGMVVVTSVSASQQTKKKVVVDFLCRRRHTDHEEIHGRNRTLTGEALLRSKAIQPPSHMSDLNLC